MRSVIACPFCIVHSALHRLTEWARQDSNLGPTDYEPAALTAELRAPRGKVEEVEKVEEVKHVSGQVPRVTLLHFPT